MVTSFISRWSKRKLDEKAKELLSTEETQVAVKANENSDEINAELSTPIDESQPAIAASETETGAMAANDADKPEEMSIANLLVSEAEQSVKKAALRKLFLSEEFNVRDGLDDYDEDYSNLKTLSQSVAETLRDWVKEQPEEASEKEQAIAAAPEAEDAEVTDSATDENTSVADESMEESISDSQELNVETANADTDDLNGEGETKYTTQ
ncbi:DUF3306 domain-containing protein [Vibrio rhodolitus]|uniref:DUF3306 domain-containing protein n=1 Tax=Vibrio rhodolitus TaxID=2231649 RepID=UPI000E0C7F1A|nr:DUF3306 domain-containing protein [Vibrio rhodolitus]